MPGIDQTLDSKALTKMPSFGQHMGTKEEEDEKEKEGNGTVAVLGCFSTQLGVQMTISGIFWHSCSTFPSKTATALPALIAGSAPMATSSSGASS